jgi:phosphonate transport system substrate-binding protein
MLMMCLALCALAGCYKPGAAGHPLGSPENPLIMAFVPSTEAERVLASGDELAALLTERTGLQFETMMATSYEAVVASLGVGRVQVAWLPPMAYLFAHQRNGDQVLMKVVRHGKPTYRGEIVVKADSPLKAIGDLKGRRLAFVEQSSASGYLYPRALLLQNGVNPDVDLKVSFAGSHDAALLALVKGSVDAACCFEDARLKLAGSSVPGIMQATRVLAYTPEIPADNVTVAKSLDPAVARRIGDGLLALAQDAKGKQVLMDLYEVEGLVPAVDSDYDPVRQMTEVLHLNLAEEVEKGQ